MRLFANGFDAPIALFVFNRPEMTRQIFNSVAKMRPRRLFLIADGPRRDRPGEAELCAEVRRIVSAVDWPCEVERNLSAANLGCGARMSSGIDWVFKSVDAAILLEDDCLPSPDFFAFCGAMLERYRHNTRIGTITGSNLMTPYMHFPDSYHFSRYPCIWGWATWRRSWALYDFAMTKLAAAQEARIVESFLGDDRVARFWYDAFDGVKDGKVDTWDYQLCFASFSNSWLNIVPSANLISNIGFGPNATHTTSPSALANVPRGCLAAPFKGPDFIVPCQDFDRLLERHAYGIRLEDDSDDKLEAVDARNPKRDIIPLVELAGAAASRFELRLLKKVRDRVFRRHKGGMNLKRDPSLKRVLLPRFTKVKRDQHKDDESGSSGYREIVEFLNSCCGPLAGKRILEAGCAPIPDFIAEIDRTFRLAEAVGINLIVKETKEFSPTLRIEYGDLRNMRFQDDYFDLIVSSSVFEHVHNLDVALAEMYRVLRPGGFLYSHFGPIWSGPYGHHLWYQEGSKLITYHTLVLPPYCHLLMSQSELEDWLECKGEPNAHHIVKFIFETGSEGTSSQNRLMFSDYEQLVSDSSFQKIFVKGYDTNLQSLYAAKITADCLCLLNERYPADRDRFLYDGITMLLQKPFV